MNEYGTYDAGYCMILYRVLYGYGMIKVFVFEEQQNVQQQIFHRVLFVLSIYACITKERSGSRLQRGTRTRVE